ncbi:solute carrier family 13 member 1-like [Glandiceps talaboti]
MVSIKKMLLRLWNLRGLLTLIGIPIVLYPLLLAGGKEGACAYVLGLVSLYWIFGVLPLTITSLIPLFLLPILGVMDSASVASAYMKDTVFFMLGAFTLAVAMEKWHLHKRLAWSTLLLTGTSPGSILLGFMLVSFFLSMWTSNTAVATIMIQIARSVADEIRRQRSKIDSMEKTDTDIVTLSEYVMKENGEANLEVDDNTSTMNELSTGLSSSEAELLETQNDQNSNVHKAFLLGIAYSSLIGGSATLVGSLQCIIMKDYLDTNYGIHVMGFTSWIAVALPCQLTIMAIGWVWLQWLFLDLSFTKLCCKGRQGQEHGKGYFKKFIRNELKELGPIRYVSITTSSIAIPILLFALPAHPKEAVKTFMKEPWLVVLVFTLVVASLCEGLGNVSVITILLPILSNLAHTMHVNPLYFIVPCTLSSNFAFMFPIASGPNIIAYSYGNLLVFDMVKAGTILNIISIAMVNVCAHTLVVWVFDVKQYPEWAPVISMNSTTPGTLNITVTS